MGTVTVTIAGVDRTAAVDKESIKITELLRARGSTCEFRLRSINGAPPMPQGGNTVVVSNGSVREFGGHVLIPSFEQWRDENGNSGFDFQVQCTDFTWELDKILVFDRDSGSSKLYASQAAGTIAANLLSLYTDGNFTTTNIQTGLTVQAQEYDVVPVSECLDKLARESGYLWYVDFAAPANVYFVPMETAIAPIDVVNLDTESRIWNVQGDTGDVSQVHNPILLKDVQLRETETTNEVVTANGVSRFYPLSYPPSPTLTDMSVTVGGNSWTVLMDDQNGQTPNDGSTASGTAFLCVFNRGIRMGSAVGSGTAIAFTYNRMKPQLAWLSDAGALAEMALAEGNVRGEHEYSISLPNAQAGNSDVIDALGQLQLRTYARPRTRLAFTTETSGWQRGQYCQVVSAGLNINRRMYVHEVTKRVKNEITWEYQIKLLDQLHGDS